MRVDGEPRTECERRSSQANEETFERAVDDIAKIARTLFDSLETSAPPKNRDLEAEKVCAMCSASAQAKAFSADSIQVGAQSMMAR